MATTTDPSKPGTGLHGEGQLDKVTDTGGTDRYATEEQHGIVTGDFDREINLRGILLSGLWLAVVTILANVLMWYFLRGFHVYDKHHEVKMLPMVEQNPQRPPQGQPLLQPENPAEDRNLDMAKMRENEDEQLNRASQVGNTLRVPVEVAIDAIAQRGVAPFAPMGGGSPAGAAGAPPATVPGAQSPEAAPIPVAGAQATPPGAAKPPVR
jgi:hypothetical protein